MTTRSGPAVSGTLRHKYWPGFTRLNPNASNMSKRAWDAASLACSLASGVSSANAGEEVDAARTHEPASAKAMAKRFISHLILAAKMLCDRVGFLGKACLFIRLRTAGEAQFIGSKWQRSAARSAGDEREAPTGHRCASCRRERLQRATLAAREERRMRRGATVCPGHY